ncbi:hypothetical protein [Micromonospora sp. IBSANI012]|uniref:hypothetical protein n=1 Tax=Micromonospora sp. IBSANI012 TaxID=3457761 RepID=UPI00405A39D5
MSTVTGPARTAGSAATLARTLVVVVIGSIMAVLDVTIVNVALHPLATLFDAPLATVQWVATGYTLALCAVIPLAAWGHEPLRRQARLPHRVGPVHRRLRR